MAKPEDPPSPNPRPRSPLPGLPKRTPTAQPAATPPTAAPAPAAPAAAAPRDKDKDSKSDATVVMSPPPPAPPAQRAALATGPAPTPRPPTTAPRGRQTVPPSPSPSPSPSPAKPSAATAPSTTTPPAATPPAATPPAAAPAPAAPEPAPAQPPRRGHPDTIDQVVMQIQAENTAPESTAPSAAAPAPRPPGASTQADLDAVRGVFMEVAVSHVAQVRDVMLELRYGDADPKWIELTKPALRSLRAMASQMELADLCEALDAFCAAVDAAVQHRAQLTGDDKAELQRRYARLIELIPQAFELDAERDRREPIIVEALLYQVPGVEQPTIEKLFAVGLGRLDALMSANAPEVAAVTGLRAELAAAIVEQFRSYRATATAAVSAPDPGTELRRLGELLITLSLQNDDFTRASSEWSDEAQQRKRRLRKEREQTFQQIKVTLARLGQREQLQRLEKLPFQERIATIDQYLSSQQPVRPST